MKQGQGTYAGAIAILQGAMLLTGCNQPDLSEGNDTPATNVAVQATSTTAATSPSSVPVAGPTRVGLAVGQRLYAGYRLDRGGTLPVVLPGMMVPPNLGPEYAAAFNRIWPDMAKRYDAVLDPFILAGVIGDRRLMLPDGVHPNAQGVDRIAARLTPVVAKRLGEL